MPLSLSHDQMTPGRRYALCVGIGTYTHLSNRHLRYAVNDANAIALRLEGSQHGEFVVTRLTEPAQTSSTVLLEALDELLNAPDRQAEDLVLIYFSCHGDVYTPDKTFCLLPSNASYQSDGIFKRTTIIGIYDLAKQFSGARVQNIVVFLDVCHSGGAGVALQHLKLDLSAGPNLFIIGAARQDQVTRESSQLEHGVFTHCLLRAFEQPPTKDGWLTISQIRSFVSDELPWFAKEHPIPIQEWSVSVNPNLPLLHNANYPELCPLPPLWDVPLPRNPFFTGQEDLLSQLASRLQREQKTALTQPQAINGLGGIGKTQLALEYAYRHRQDYHAILWGGAETREALISTFVRIAHLLDLSQKDEKDEMVIVEAVKRWLMDRSHWLFILDNADELALVKEFIPPAFRGHLLLTTRAQVVGKLAHKLEVGAMPSESGALLLLRRARLLAPKASLGEAPDGEVAMAKELVEALGGLPLALDQAGAYIDEKQCHLTDYQSLYHMQRAKMLKERGDLCNDYPESVATTWSLSFQEVEQKNPAAAELLRFCAWLHPDAIPEEIITTGAEHLGPLLQQVARDPFALNNVIAALGAYSLMHRNAKEKTLRVHRLVQAVLKDVMSEATQDDWERRTIRAVNAVFPTVEFTTWPQCERYLPHALACAEAIRQGQISFPESARLLHQTGHYLRERGLYLEAESISQLGLHIREMILGPAHLDVAETLNNLAQVYYALGTYGQAELFCQRALAIRQHALGPDHPHVAQSLDILVEIYEIQGKYTQAETYCKRALTIWEKTLGPEHQNVANSLCNLALLSYDQSRYDLAESLYQRVLLIEEHTIGPDHPDTATTLNNLAVLYHDQGKYGLAEPLYRRALAIDKQALGSKHPQTATDLCNLGWLYHDQGKYDQAEPLYHQALAINEQVLGLENPQTAIDLCNLGRLYHDQGKYDQAEPLYHQALAIDKQAFGQKHKQTASDLCNLGRLYYDQGKYDQAEQLSRQALNIRKQKLGATHPDTAQSLNNLAALYKTQGKYVEAEPLLKRALTIREQKLGATHPDTAQSLNNLADLYNEQGKYAKAESLLKRALSIRQQQLGSQHPDTAQSLNNLALLYYHQGKYSEVEPLYQHALQIREQQLGPLHPDTAQSLNNLALLYTSQEKYAEAEPLLERALVIREKQLGASHPDVARSLNNLAALYERQDMYSEAEPLLKRALSISERTLGQEHPQTQALRENYARLLQEMQGDPHELMD